MPSIRVARSAPCSSYRCGRVSVSQRLRKRWPLARSSRRSAGKLYSSPFWAAHTVPSSLATGCRPPSTSTMLSRQAPREKSDPPTAWASSGPRWESEASMLHPVSMSLRPKTPQIPHMSALQRHVGARLEPLVHRRDGVGRPHGDGAIEDAFLYRARPRIHDVLRRRGGLEAPLGLAQAHVLEDQHVTGGTRHGARVTEEPVAKEGSSARRGPPGGEQGPPPP